MPTESEKEDQIKEAFQRVKRDIELLNKELLNLKEDIRVTRKEMIKICEILKHLTSETPEKPAPTPPIYPLTHPTHRQINSTHPTHIPTHFLQFNKENSLFSTGNEGVPTDRQTNQQTDNTSTTDNPTH